MGSCGPPDYWPGAGGHLTSRISTVRQFVLSLTAGDVVTGEGSPAPESEKSIPRCSRSTTLNGLTLDGREGRDNLRQVRRPLPDESGFLLGARPTCRPSGSSDMVAHRGRTAGHVISPPKRARPPSLKQIANGIIKPSPGHRTDGVAVDERPKR